MTAKELLDILNYYAKRHPEQLDNTVVISTSKYAVPTNFVSDVYHVHFGSDWEKNLLIIHPKDNLVPVKKLSKPTREVAKDRLQEIEEGYKKCGQDYGIKKSQRESWFDGFCEGVRMQVTDVNSENEEIDQLQKRVIELEAIIEEIYEQGKTVYM